MKEKLTKESVGYAQIKNEVLQDKYLSLKAKGMFAYIYSKPDDWDFSGDRMAQENLDGRKSIYSALKELESSGYLERIKRPDGKSDYHIRYTKKPDVQKGQEATEPNAQNGKEPKRQEAEKGSISNKEIITNKENITNKVSSPKIPFEEFWNAYDKKTGRPKSEKKWNALSLKDQEAIMEHIPKYKIAQPNKTYRKNPETFFNNRSWEDELIADTSANKGMWKCDYGHMHKKGEECGHAQERIYQNSQFSVQLSDKFKIKKE